MNNKRLNIDTRYRKNEVRRLERLKNTEKKLLSVEMKQSFKSALNHTLQASNQASQKAMMNALQCNKRHEFKEITDAAFK